MLKCLLMPCMNLALLIMSNVTVSETGNIHIKGTLDLEYYTAAHHLSTARLRFWLRSISTVIGISFLSLPSLLAFITAPIHPVTEIYFLSVGFFLALYGSLLAPFVFNLRISRLWRKRAAALEALDLHFSAKGIKHIRPNNRTYFVAWADITMWTKNKKICLLYLSEHRWLPVPLGWLDNTTQQSIITLLQQKLGKNKA